MINQLIEDELGKIEVLRRALDQVFGPVLTMAEIRKMEKVRREVEMERYGQERVLRVDITVSGGPPPGRTEDEWLESLTERIDDSIRESLNGVVNSVELSDWGSVG